MMNYDFHENLTPEKIDELIDGMKKKEAAVERLFAVSLIRFSPESAQRRR